MAATTTAQFARQLRRLGATVTITDGRHVVARHRGVEVTARFHREIDAFDVAWRSDASYGAVAEIRSMAGVRRALGLPKQPVITLGQTGRRNWRVHILRPGWFSIAECGGSLRTGRADGLPPDVTCPRCRPIGRQR
nr:hypothetical protein [Micromonospora purpureochromogenes]